jgi:hypothetical protein
MIEFAPGLWDIADRSLQWIGRGATGLVLKRPSRGDESATYAVTGGALVCAVFGGVVGFTLSHASQDTDAIGGTMLGGSLGVCLGIIFGSFVVAVDSAIKDLLRSLNSQ